MDFDTLYAKYHAVVRRRVVRLMGEDRADDACQEAWIRIWRHLHTFNGDARITSWLHRVATNAAYDTYRREHRQMRGQEPIGNVDAWESPVADPERAYIATAALARVTRELQRMPVIVQVVVWSAAEGGRRGDVGREMGIPAATVQSRLHRARRRLQASA